MTNLNLTKLIDDAFDAIEEALGVKPKQTTEEPVKENTAPEAPAEEPTEDFEFEVQFEIDLFDDEDSVSAAWEAIELLRKAEVAADKGDEVAATSYTFIADRYIRLADIFAETEVTFTP